MIESKRTEVICPACTYQFRAIPLDVQGALNAMGFEPPYREFVASKASLEYVANIIRDECHSAAFKAGWWQVPIYGEPYSGRKEDVRNYPLAILQWWIGIKIALMHSELSEALEGERKDKMDDHLPHLKSRDVEFADAIIRIMDLCGGLGIDIGRAITEKLAYNAQREDHKVENRDKAGGKAF